MIALHACKKMKTESPATIVRPQLRFTDERSYCMVFIWMAVMSVVDLFVCSKMIDEASQILCRRVHRRRNPEPCGVRPFRD